MKIINRKEFMKMKRGTIFSYYEPCMFDGLYIKEDDNSKIDFLFSNFIGAIKCNSSDDFFDKCRQMEFGESVDTDFSFIGREGLFDEKQLFAIYEPKDIKKLINKIKS